LALSSPDGPGSAGGRPETAVIIATIVPVLLGLYLLLTSTSIVISGIWPYDAKRILQLILLVVLCLLPLLNVRIRHEISRILQNIPAWLRYSLTFFLTVGVLSVLVHAESWMHAANSFSEVVLFTLLLFAVIVTGACRRIAGKYFDRVAISLLALTGLAVGVQELVGVLAASGAGVDFSFRVSLLYFSWPRFYNQVQAWMIPALAALPLLFGKSRLTQVLCLLVLGLQWYIIMMTGARGAFVSVMAGLVFALVFLPPVRKLLFGWQAAGLLLGGLIYAAVLFHFEADSPRDVAQDKNQPQTQAEAPGNQPKGFYLNEDGSKSAFYQQSLGRPMANTSGRIRDWKIAVSEVVAHPLIGIGPMNLVCTSSVPWGHPHNFPLQLAMEWGVPVAGLACLLFLLLLKSATALLRNHTVIERQENIIACCLLTGIVSAALYSCLSGVLVMPASQTAAILVCGMFLGLVPPGAARPGKDRPNKERRLASLLPIFVLSLGLLALGLHELATMEQRADQLLPGEGMHPRTWQDSMVCKFYTSKINHIR